MHKVINLIKPTEEILYTVSLLKENYDIQYKILITDKPFPSSDIFIVPFHQLSSLINANKEFSYIPYIVYGKVSLIDRAFSLGASDYIKPPFSIKEILTRSLRLIQKDKICFYFKIIDFDLCRLICRNKTVPLTESEYRLLHTLTTNAGRTVSRVALNHFLGLGNDLSRSLDVHINSLRKKLSIITEQKKAGKEIIVTIKGRGYTINSQFSCG